MAKIENQLYKTGLNRAGVSFPVGWSEREKRMQVLCIRGLHAML
jgi:hypothetical protein